MNFDKNTLTVLNNFGSINPSIKVNQGSELRTVSHTKSIFAKANVDANFETQFCVYDLSRFLTTVSLFDSPEFDITSDNITIKQGTNKVKYALASPETIISPKDTDPDLGQSHVSFVLTNQILQQTLKAASVLKLTNLSFKNDAGKIVLEALDAKERISDNYEIEIGETDKEFNLIFDIDNFKLIPQDYTVNIHRIGDIMLANFKSLGEIQVEYIIALDTKSKF